MRKAIAKVAPENLDAGRRSVLFGATATALATWHPCKTRIHQIYQWWAQVRMPRLAA
jgi:hypothetical protein